MNGLTVALCVQRFLTHILAAGLSPHTHDFYRQQLSAFVKCWGARDPLSLTVQDVAEYLLRRRREGRPAASLHTEGKALHAFLHWGADREWVSADTVARMRVPKLPRREIRPFTDDQVRALLDATKHTMMPERNRAIVLVLADSGIRCAELCGLRDEDVASDELRVLGKGSRERWVPISEPTAEAIDRWRWLRPVGSQGWLFVQWAGQRLRPRGPYHLFRRLGEIAGLRNVRVSPHTMRHTVGVSWVRSGGNVFALQRLLGHSSLEMTRRYVALASEDVAREHREHSLVGRLG